MTDWKKLKPSVPATTKPQDIKQQEQGAKPLDRAEALEELRERVDAFQSANAHAFILIDRSSSMSLGDKMKQARLGTMEFAETAIKKGYDVGLVSFGTVATLDLALSQDLKGIKYAVKRLTPAGFTDMAAALELAGDQLRSEEGNRAVVVVTDGEPTEPEATLRAADRLKGMGIEIITVGTSEADEAFLAKLASRSDLAEVVRPTMLRTAIAKAASKLALPPPPPE
jgi:Mg-chelatase subunit ChlD